MLSRRCSQAAHRNGRGPTRRPSKRCPPIAGSQAYCRRRAPIPEIAASPAAATDDRKDDAAGVPLNAAAPPTAPLQAPESAPLTVIPAARSTQPAQDLAFAARLQPTQSTDRSTLPAEMASASAVASASKKVVAAADEVATAPAEAHAVLTAATASVERDTQPTALSHPLRPPHRLLKKPKRRPQPRRTGQAFGPAQRYRPTNQSARQRRVEVRVVQQGAEVHVSVHSSDASLNSGLRQGLSDLQSRLEETGYRSEMWRPGVSPHRLRPQPRRKAPPAIPVAAMASRGKADRKQESDSRNPNQSNQPRWVEEMESNLGAERNRQEVSMASAVNGVAVPIQAILPARRRARGTAPTEQMFLQLLVAQLQNQDPLNPTDSTSSFRSWRNSANSSR